MSIAGMRVEHDINVSYSEIVGKVRATGSHIKGSFVIAKSTLTSSDGVALFGKLLRIGGNLVANNGFTCSGGGVDIEGAEIEGNVNLVGATIRTEKGFALNLDHAVIKLGVHAEDLRTTGSVSLHHATISCQISLGRGRIETSDEYAIRADHVIIRGSMLLNGGRWRGASLRLRGTRILGDVDLRGATADHTVDFTSSTIGQTVNLQGAVLAAKEGDALIASNARISQLQFQLRENPVRPVNLRNAQLEILADTKNTWPPAGSINLEGCRYRQLDSDLTNAERLHWLSDATPNFSPQPYEQLAEMYKARGNADEERKVRLQAIQRMYAARGSWQRAWGFLQNATVGYGYRPSRALLAVAVLWVGGALWFAYGVGSCNYNGVDNAGLCPVNLTNHPIWNPVVLSMDLLIPFGAFGQDNAWRLTGISVLVAVLLTLSGWVLVTTIAAAVARTFRH